MSAVHDVRVPFFRPYVRREDIAAVSNAMRSPNLTTGPELDRFEKRIADYVGTKYAVAFNSGTACLKIALQGLGIKTGDEVITSAYGHPATAVAILASGARPVFADISPLDLNMDPGSAEANVTVHTKAILAVHLFGLVGNMPRLIGLAQSRRLSVIEDACEALGSAAYGKKAGSFGEAGAFSFHPMKVVTTSQGGALVTNNDGLYFLAQKVRRQEIVEVRGRMIVGEGGKLSSLNCALGLSQAGNLERTIEIRLRLARRYYELLQGQEKIRLLDLSGQERISWFQFPIILAEGFKEEDRDRLMSRLLSAGIEVKASFPSVPSLSQFGFLGNRPGDYRAAESISHRVIALPFFTSMAKADQHEVCGRLIEELKLL